jgi:hypothetical protein
MTVRFIGASIRSECVIKIIIIIIIIIISGLYDNVLQYQVHIQNVHFQH